MTSEEILKKITVKFSMLQLMETNLVEVLERRQTNDIKKNINLAEKRLDEIGELKIMHKKKRKRMKRIWKR